MILSIKKYIFFFFLATAVMGCIEPFDVTIPGGNDRLVVEGLITDDPGPYTVKLSRSSLLTENNFPPVRGAVVTIEEENGDSEILTEIIPGEYQTSSLQGTPGKRYRLRVSLPDSKSYATEWILLKRSPQIDSVYSEYDEQLVNLEPKEGYQFFVDSRDPSNETTYYRYEWTESWKYAVPYPSTSIYLGNDQVQAFTREERIDQCWTFEEFTGISIATSLTAEQDVISRHPLIYVTSDPAKLKIRYGLWVRQYAVNEEEYRFWEGLRQTSEESGALFDQQPEVVRSNLINENNPDEQVFGYFSVSGVSRGASFIDFRDVPFGVGNLNDVPCNSPFLNIQKGPESELLIQEALSNGWLFYRLNYPLLGVPNVVIGYTMVNPSCGDCRSRGGTTQAPEWWEER